MSIFPLKRSGSKRETQAAEWAVVKVSFNHNEADRRV